MSVVDRDTQLRMRGESGLVLERLARGTVTWFRTQIDARRQMRQRKMELDCLLELRDWHLHDIGASRGQLQDERDRLGWTGPSNAQNVEDVSRRFLRR